MTKASKDVDLLYGNQADNILMLFGLLEESEKYDTVRLKFNSHLVKCCNVIYEHAKFNMWKQKDGEPVDAFITNLHTLAQY